MSDGDEQAEEDVDSDIQSTSRQYLSVHSSSLPYLLKVGELGSIRQAAEALNIASSAINRKILKIERELGVSLFTRTVKGMTPTTSGALLLEHARSTLSDYQRTVDEIINRKGNIRGRVNITGISSFIEHVLPNKIIQFCETYPEISMKIVDENPGRIIDETMAGNFDIAITFVDGRHHGLELCAKIDAPLGAVMRSDHPLAGRESLTLTDCAGYSTFLFSDRLIIEALAESEFRRTGATFKPRILTNSMAVMNSGVISGLGIGFFTPIGFLDDIRDGRIVHVPLLGNELLPNGIGLYAAKGITSSQPGRAVVDFLMKEFAIIEKKLGELRLK
ncbi:LysR family transcriptional regulator [Hoeflea sp. CAU 1731]